MSMIPCGSQKYWPQHFHSILLLSVWSLWEVYRVLLKHPIRIAEVPLTLKNCHGFWRCPRTAVGDQILLVQWVPICSTMHSFSSVKGIRSHCRPAACRLSWQYLLRRSKTSNSLRQCYKFDISGTTFCLHQCSKSWCRVIKLLSRLNCNLLWFCSLRNHKINYWIISCIIW